MIPEQACLAVTGCYGLVGRRLVEARHGVVPLDVSPPPPDCEGKVRSEFPPVDITDARSVADAFRRLGHVANGRHLVVVHMAALTDTKGGREDVFENVNVRGTENMLNATDAAGGTFVHISTDYVFAGEDREGSAYTEADRPSKEPAGVYAASKFRAERLVLERGAPDRAVVARIAFPYGGMGNRPGLAEKMLQRLEEARRTKQAVRLFDDQTICPSYIPDVVRGLLEIVDRAAAGGLSSRVFHLTGDPTTPMAFGELLRDAFGMTDVVLEAASVAGTVYARNLWLSHDATAAALEWSPTPHADALSQFKRG